MRAIKFRAWDKKRKKMVGMGWEQSFSVFSDEDFIVEQFTGLHDKNGQEIYEGDLLETLAGETGVVTYEEGAFELSKSPIHGYICRLCSRLPESFELIGNIHENPELLK